MKRLFGWRMVAAGALSVLSLAGILIHSAASADSSAIVDCPSENRLVLAGSTCKWVPDGEYWVLVSPGPIIPPCERAEPPAEAIASTCEIVDHLAKGTNGDSALLRYQSKDGGYLRVFVFPSGLTMPMDSSVDS
jgi:hypothetical protein